MFTVLKIREGIPSYEDPGWYKHPEGTVALAAAAGICGAITSKFHKVRRRPPTGTS